MEKLIIGAHVSFKKDSGLLGCVNEALSYGANTFMFYTGAPQNTKRLPISGSRVEEAFSLMKQSGINPANVIVHAPYIINLANTVKKDNFPFAINFLKEEISRCEEMGMKKLVLHPGSHVTLSKEEGLNNIVEGLNEVINENQSVTICLETMAGKGTELGTSIEDLKYIMDNVKYNDKLNICLDTCHLNDAGYDMSNFDKYLDEFDSLIGLNKVGCIHINDSKNEKGAHKDRHENIGIGTIGFDNLISIIYNKRLKDIPKILETPYVSEDDNSKQKIYPPYKFEIEMIKNKKNNIHLIDDIRSYYK